MDERAKRADRMSGAAQNRFMPPVLCDAVHRADRGCLDRGPHDCSVIHSMTATLLVLALVVPGRAFAEDVRVIPAGFYGVLRRARSGLRESDRSSPCDDPRTRWATNRTRYPRDCAGELADVVILDGHAADALAAGGIVRADTKVGTRVVAGRNGGARRRQGPRYQHCRRVQTDPPRGAIRRLPGQRQRHVSFDRTLREARDRGSDRAQEPQGAATRQANRWRQWSPAVRWRSDSSR